MFRQPVGMLMYMQDSNDQTLGAVYLEQCYIQGHNMGFDSSSIVVQEQVSVQCERLVPVAVSSIHGILVSTHSSILLVIHNHSSDLNCVGIDFNASLVASILCALLSEVV